MTSTTTEHGRNKTDQELEDLIKDLDEDETHGLKFGLLPARLEDRNLSNKDVAQLMELTPEGHY